MGGLRKTPRYYSDMPYSRSGDLVPAKEISQTRNFKIRNLNEYDTEIIIVIVSKCNRNIRNCCDS